ncbi:hypothetical protein F4777DRAFT_569377 [Nemania sp. FL0916]|nr:hypothetical protein F4777DRAFT_569377 [Nemania sp. FL0916]
MRPLGDDTWAGRQRQRGSGLYDHNPQLTTSSLSNHQMSFVIADESSLDSCRGSSALPAHCADPKKPVESFQRDERDHLGDDAPSCSVSSRASPFSHSPISLLSQAPPSSASRPITPIMLGPSCLGSVYSNPSSRRNSFTSSLSDHAMGYDLEFPGEPATTSSMLDSGSAPQLVMPSINMPSRRPFTETGKNLGRLKILLAGGCGTGKTSLLKAIVQTCSHIVHVDPILSSNEGASSKRGRAATAAVSEVHASTRPCPEWWQELDTACVPHKRKRMGDKILERNICFVDTPGYGRESSVMETIMSCVDYVESHLRKVLSADLSDSDLLNMLGGVGGCQVDAVLYLISWPLKPADLEYIRRLVPLTNVIPLLARAERLSESQMMAQKQEIAGQLEHAGIRPFTFTSSVAQEKQGQHVPSIPYSVSSVAISEHDIMDASLLMSPDYIQPLIPTELAFLVETMFSPDGASWLRHSAAKKYLQWRELKPGQPLDLYRPLSASTTDHASRSAQLSLALAKYQHPQQEGEIRQIQVADWAAELQRSLISERQRYEALARGDRVVWLTEQLHECVQGGTLVSVNSLKDASGKGGRRGKSGGHGATETQQHQDPLGLLQAAVDLKVRGRTAVEVISGLGAVGLAVWISRHGWLTRATELLDEWLRS